MITKLRKFLEFDLQKSWSTGRREQELYKVHPSHRAIASPLAWSSAHSRGQEFESSRTREVVEAMVEIFDQADHVYGLSEGCLYCDEGIDGVECLCFEYLNKASKLREALANLRAKLDQAEGIE